MADEKNRDDAWYEKRDKECWSELPEPERTIQRDMGKEQVKAWKAQQQQQADEAVSCLKCKDLVSLEDNPILLCDGCTEGALHFLCTEPQLKSLPSDDEDVSSCWCLFSHRP